jgi:hypothetical protein
MNLTTKNRRKQMKTTIRKMGVHDAKKLIDSGKAKRCNKDNATHIIPRGGCYRDYYITTAQPKKIA